MIRPGDNPRPTTLIRRPAARSPNIFRFFLKQAVIMDVEAMTAIRQAEVGAAKTMLDHTAEFFDVAPSRLVADAGYGSAEMIGWLVDERGIEPLVKLMDKSERSGALSRSDFAFDPEGNRYVCPGGKELRKYHRLFFRPRDGMTKEGTMIYFTRKHDCEACALKAKCCPNAPARKIARSIHEAARDKARAIAHSWPRRSMENRTSAGPRSAFRRSRRSSVPTRMNRAVVRPQQVTPCDLEIAAINEAAVALDQRGPIEAVEFWKLVPGQSVAQVMRRMEVVEQEQRPQNLGVFDDRRPTLRLGHGAMFGERAHHGEARPRIDEAGDVEPKGHPCDDDDPDQDRRALQEVAAEPHSCAGLVAPSVLREIADEAADQKGGAESDAPEERRLGVPDRAPHRPQAAQSARRPVVAFGVLERIGEILVPVMRQMGRAVDRIGEPERQRPAADRVVDRAVAGRMAVNGFVLKVQLPGDDPGADRGQPPPRQIAVEIGGHEPRPVDDKRERRRWPLDVALQRRKFDDLH